MVGLQRMAEVAMAAPVSCQAWRIGLPFAGLWLRATESISTPA